MASKVAIRKNEYYDSVFLMGVNKRLSQAPGIGQTAVLMGSESNKRLLADIGIRGPEIDSARPNDMIVAVTGDDSAAVELAIAGLDEILKALVSQSPATGFRTLEAALQHQPKANLAVISIPGEFVAAEARKAMQRGLNVFIFSSNVSRAEELELKRLGGDRGLLVMGPDCGTSLIGGVGIGFANAVRRGPIGALGPSGTGLQEFTTQVHNAGGGISHAIGTGSNDLADEIGGLTTLEALRRLESDPSTEVVVLIAKPPGVESLAVLAAHTRGYRKPLVGCLFGSSRGAGWEGSPIRWARTIDEAASLALGVAGMDAAQVPEDTPSFETVRTRWPAGAHYLRGIFAGGTFCYQAQQILAEAGLSVSSNAPIRPGFGLPDPDISRENTLVDMGDEHYTVGKPHPMIDGTERARRIRAEAADPSVAILLIDFILGYNASHDPVGDLRQALLEGLEARRKTGGDLTVVASVCGTRDDPQDLDLQMEMLRELGVIVFRSSARAAMYCARLLMAGGEPK